jgi:DNA-binding cell septation regulator SpoVG
MKKLSKVMKDKNISIKSKIKIVQTMVIPVMIMDGRVGLFIYMKEER